VSSPSVPNPAAVRYGWADFPVVNLFNKNGLPATPFRTDSFPMTTGPKLVLKK
jgi:sialate O-acetylesterase